MKITLSFDQTFVECNFLNYLDCTFDQPAIAEYRIGLYYLTGGIRVMIQPQTYHTTVCGFLYRTTKRIYGILCEITRDILTNTLRGKILNGFFIYMYRFYTFVYFFILHFIRFVNVKCWRNGHNAGLKSYC